jgi:regulator of RNase E activity RraA
MNERERESKFLVNRLDKKIIEEYYKVTTCMVSDALDKLGLPAGVWGIGPMHGKCKKIVGPAITMKIVPYGSYNPSGHMGSDPMAVAEAGDVLVYDNGGRLDQNCWGDIVTWSSIQRGIIGTIVDGAVRDMDEVEEIGFPVFARGHTPLTARGRNVQADYNCVIQIGGVQCNPGDIVMADVNGVAIVPESKAKEILAVALDIRDKEAFMIEQIKGGISFLEVDKKSGYDKYLQKKSEAYSE